MVNGLLRSPYILLCLQGFFFWLAYDLARFPVIPRLAQELGLSPQGIGLAVAASTITGIFVKFISGGISDSLGRKVMMMIACGVAVLLPPMYFLVHSGSSLIALRLLHGLGTAIMGPVARAAVSDIVPPESRGGRLASYLAVINLGAMIGRSLGGFLLFWGGFLYPFAASAASGLIALIVCLRWPKDRPHSPDLGEIFRRMIQGFREVGSNVVILGSSLAEAVQFLALGAIDAFLPIYATRELGLDDHQIGLLYGSQVATMILMKPVMGMASDRFGRKGQIVLGLLFGGILLSLFPFTRSFVGLLTVVVLVGLGASMVSSATSALTTDVCQREHYGAAHGVFGTILDLGHATGPLLTGFLIGQFGFQKGYGMVSLFLILTSLLFLILIRGRRG